MMSRNVLGWFSRNDASSLSYTTHLSSLDLHYNKQKGNKNLISTSQSDAIPKHVSIPKATKEKVSNHRQRAKVSLALNTCSHEQQNISIDMLNMGKRQ
mgnify:CR=1 FL=1